MCNPCVINPEVLDETVICKLNNFTLREEALLLRLWYSPSFVANF